jgi:hypothetical protein
LAAFWPAIIGTAICCCCGRTCTLIHKLPDIALTVHIGVALCFMLAPLHLRFFGLLAVCLAAVAVAFTVFFYGQQPNAYC